MTYAYNVPVAIGGPAGDERMVGGSADQVIARLAGLVADLGLTAVNVWPAGESAGQAERFATEVLPRLR
jgi:alkanesulfonate monooxygenase SsuD/methylene tetrahydromethanopterin reductase-like flavin-dependent oxidoreductase (luciferase family)